ncbi:WD40-repeat-containing domain protein [Crepidotus variabilis]|uniref:WD40-repeat-containing domain protein n=1 Tax=Crepidotus variabilis TaxID=179855 RepID=A0A9P6JM67_9AGAR|nr:WD40-repeat-containing domain protein [Crepidotus variabilis]
MSVNTYPHSNLFLGPTRTIDITGSHIHVIDNTSGELIFSTTTFNGPEQEAVLKSGLIRCAAIDRSFQYLLTAGEDKLLKLWQIESLKLLNQRDLPKRPTALAFSADSQTLVVSDKFGDVFSYPFAYDPPLPSEAESKDKGKEKERETISSHENPSGGTLILGHTSPVNGFLLTNDEKFIITADRDEHIRVSRFPKGYIIEMFCLGHLKFVSSIHIPASAPSLLISGGGDPVLKVWDWMSGKCKHELRIWETVDQFLVVKGVKRQRGWWDGEDGEGGGEDAEDLDTAANGGGKGGRAKRGRRGRNKKKGKDDNEEGDDITNASQPIIHEKVLVISHIGSIKSGPDDWVVFSAVGSTAIFAFPLKLDVASSQIRHFDFGRPVLGFTVVEDDNVMVSLDVHWVSSEHIPQENEKKPSESVRVIKLFSGEFLEEFEYQTALVATINSKALVEASPADLKKLELYADLTSMPKFSIEPETSSSSASTLIPTSAAFASDPSGPLAPGTDSPAPSSIPIGAPELSTNTVAKANKGKRRPQGVVEGEPTKRETARMRAKEAVMRKAKEQAEANLKGKIMEEDVQGEVEEPIAKKLRSEDGTPDEDEISKEDVLMTDAR